MRYLTVSAQSGSGRYRVRASIEPRAKNFILIIGAPLNGVDSTLHRLLLVELLVTAAVLAAITALGLWVVRLGLRPLRAIERTAAAKRGKPRPDVRERVAAMQADPEWQAFMEESAKLGALEHQENRLMIPASFFPLKR